jgi:hypothetical protein
MHQEHNFAAISATEMRSPTSIAIYTPCKIEPQAVGNNLFNLGLAKRITPRKKVEAGDRVHDVSDVRSAGRVMSTRRPKSEGNYMRTTEASRYSDSELTVIPSS